MLQKAKAWIFGLCVIVACVILATILRRQDLAQKLKSNFDLGRAKERYSQAEIAQEKAREEFRKLAHEKGALNERIKDLEVRAKEAERGRVVDLNRERDRRGWR